MDLSVLLVSWNTRELLRDCLGSVPASCGGLTHEVVVVDNGSEDGSAAMVSEQFPHVQLVANRDNLGFAAATNQAIDGARGRYLLLLNPDTLCGEGALATLASFMDSHPDAGAAGPRLTGPDGRLQLSCSPLPSLAREAWRLFHLDALRPYAEYPMHWWPLTAARPVDVIQGACMILRRKAVDQVGPLDDAYFMYTEEVDLCHRLRRAGWGIYWVPDSVVVHLGGRSTELVALPMFLQLYRSKTIFFRKNQGAAAARAYKLVILLASLARLVASPLAWLEASSSRGRHLTLASRYWRLVTILPRM